MALAYISERLDPAPDVSRNLLNARIESLRIGFAGHQNRWRSRAKSMLLSYSPDFESRLGEFDQWDEPFLQENDGHARNSYNLARAVVEIWSALEASKFPVVRWNEGYLPVPPPSTDPMQNDQRLEAYRAMKRVGRQMATMREQALIQHIRRSKAHRHFYNSVTRRNVFGLAWQKTWPDMERRTFRIISRIDASTVFPVWSKAEDRRLDAVLVAYRQSATTANARFPGLISMSNDGLTLDAGAEYYSTAGGSTDDQSRAFVWIEDYWYVDDEWYEEPGDDAPPIRSRVVNCIRVNGKIAQVATYPGWRQVPYIPYMIDNLRDDFGFSDVGTVQPIQSGINHFLSQQQDVIHGESRPKFKFRSEDGRQVVFRDDEIVDLFPEEDIEQIKVNLDVFPTQIHGQQLLEMLARTSGLSDAVWGRITQAANSGRALAVAWRAVASRMVPRGFANEEAIEGQLTRWLDWMELYRWDNAPELYQGSRDFVLDFPNQEPRELGEIVMTTLNKLNAGGIDLQGAMEEWGEASPDEMLERVRTDYMDPVLHPEKSQSMLALQSMKNDIEIKAQQAGIEQATAMAQLQAMGQQAAGAQPGAVAAGQATAANNQEAARNAPTLSEGDNAPASQAGDGPNAGSSTQQSTLIQDGKPAMNRIITKGPIG